MSLASFDVNTYSSDGRIIQVEYAMKAMNLGTTTIGIALRDCVVLVSEKKLASALQTPQTVKKHFKIYDTILAGVSGISGDAPCIIEKCRQHCIQHEKIFNEQISIENLMEGICSLALKFGESNFEKKIFSRPFGVSILIAAYENGPKLYSIDPSGSFLGYRARTIGSAQEVVETVLESEYNENESKEDCIRRTLVTLKNVMKDKMNKFNVEVSCVGKDGIEMLTPDEISEFL